MKKYNIIIWLVLFFCSSFKVYCNQSTSYESEDGSFAVEGLVFKFPNSTDDCEFELYHSDLILTSYTDDCKCDPLVIPAYVEYQGKQYCVEVIGHKAFQDFKELKTVVLPPTLKKIGYRSFQNSGLREIYIPANVTEIHPGAFVDCRDLKKVIFLPGKPITIYIGEYGYCYYGEAHLPVFMNDHLEKVAIGRSCSTYFWMVGEYWDNGHPGAEEVRRNLDLCTVFAESMVDNLYYTNNEAANSCQWTNIEQYNYVLNNEKIGCVCYGEDVTEIRYGWPYETLKVICLNPTPPSRIKYPTAVNPYMKIYVPNGAEEIYKTHDFWKRYSDNIQGFSGIDIPETDTPSREALFMLENRRLIVSGVAGSYEIWDLSGKQIFAGVSTEAFLFDCPGLYLLKINGACLKLLVP